MLHQQIQPRPLFVWKKGMDLKDFITLALVLNLLIPFDDSQHLSADSYMNYIPAFDNLNFSPESIRSYKEIKYDQRYEHYIISPTENTTPYFNGIIFYHDLKDVVQSLPHQLQSVDIEIKSDL